MLYSAASSPLGELLLLGEGGTLTGLWFTGQEHLPARLSDDKQGEAPVFSSVRRWLDIYFSGREPDFFPPIALSGTPFQLAVWEALRQIPYGAAVSYKQIGELVARKTGKRVSYRAVGGAVGRNPVGILVPCHRVIGSDGSLTGYASGLWRKEYLLKLERGEISFAKRL